MARVDLFYDGVFSRFTGTEREAVSVNPPTLTALLEILSRSHGEGFARAVIDPATGELKAGIAILGDGRYLHRESLLKDGMEVSFLTAIAGGAGEG